jgi:hypothetical protein
MVVTVVETEIYEMPHEDVCSAWYLFLYRCRIYRIENARTISFRPGIRLKVCYECLSGLAEDNYKIFSHDLLCRVTQNRGGKKTSQN